MRRAPVDLCLPSAFRHAPLMALPNDTDTVLEQAVPPPNATHDANACILDPAAYHGHERVQLRIAIEQTYRATKKGHSR